MPTSASFFIIASGTKKNKKNCKKVLTFVSQNDIIIMGENNNKRETAFIRQINSHLAENIIFAFFMYKRP